MWQPIASVAPLHEIAICSPNFIQVGKCRDWKMVFHRVKRKKCRVEGENFLC